MKVSTLLALLFLVIASCDTMAQDAGEPVTTITHEFSPSYIGLLDTLKISFDFKEPTSSMEGRLTFDSKSLLFVGALLPSNSEELGGSLMFSNPNAFEKDTTLFSLAWTNASTIVSDVGFVFVPMEAGPTTLALSFLEFDERVPANDGINYYEIGSEILPLDQFPGLVNTEDYIERLEACQYIENWYWPNILRGDASGNGETTSYDASLILQLQALVIDSLPTSSYTFDLPSFCD